MSPAPPRIESEEEYRRLFPDAAVWRPCVEAVLDRHDLPPARDMRCPVLGSYPTYVVDGRTVVKLFSRWFGGWRSHEVERALGERLAADGFPVPRVLATGQLDPEGDDPWPYLVLEAVPGRSLGEVREELSPEDLEEVARFVAGFARDLHAIDDPVGPLVQEWPPFARWIERRRREAPEELQRSPDVPGWVVDGLVAFLPDSLVDTARPPRLLHADLTGDHVLLDRDGSGRWRPTGIIDLGDARFGDPAYELVALQLDALAGDVRLLRTFLDAYGDDAAFGQDLPRRALAFTLLHPFDVPAWLFRGRPGLRDVASLDALAAVLIGEQPISR